MVLFFFFLRSVFCFVSLLAPPNEKNERNNASFVFEPTLVVVLFYVLLPTTSGGMANRGDTAVGFTYIVRSRNGGTICPAGSLSSSGGSNSTTDRVAVSIATVVAVALRYVRDKRISHTYSHAPTEGSRINYVCSQY